MTLKLWCSKCPRPCYIEKKYSTPEEKEELLKNAVCPFSKKDYLLFEAI